MKEFLSSVRKTLFPTDLTCDICGRETFGANICGECRKTLIANDGITCPVCGRRAQLPVLCVECKAEPPLYKKAVSAYVYGGGAAALIKRFKDGAGYLKEFFADGICEKLKTLPAFDCIIGVPMTRRAKSRRGFNQSELLAQAVSVRTGVPYVKGAMKKTKETGEQKKLTQTARRKNLKGSFKVVKKAEVAGKRVLIIDDVLTTGATSAEITKALLKAGAKCAYLATIASVEYKLN